MPDRSFARMAHFENGRFAIRESMLPTLRAGEVLVEVHGCGVCGSDLHFYGGAMPPPEVCPGHEICGHIGSDAPGLARGCPVVVEPVVACGRCRQCTAGEPNLCPYLQLVGTGVPGGFADAVVVPVSSVYPVPDGLDLDVAVLTEPLAVAIHASEGVRLERGVEALVIGGGTIGLLTAFAATRTGASVTIAVRYPHQRAAAMYLGIPRIVDGGDDAVRAATATTPPDVVFETVGGAAPTMPLALACVRPGGSVVMLGVFSRPLVLDPVTLLAKEVRLVPSMMYDRCGVEPDFVTALRLLRDESARLRSLVTHALGLTAIDDAFAIACDKRSGAIKVVVRPDRSR